MGERGRERHGLLSILIGRPSCERGKTDRLTEPWGSICSRELCGSGLIGVAFDVIQKASADLEVTSMFPWEQIARPA